MGRFFIAKKCFPLPSHTSRKPPAKVTLFNPFLKFSVILFTAISQEKRGGIFDQATQAVQRAQFLLLLSLPPW